MDEINKIIVDEFQKKEDGSWVSVKNADIMTKAGKVIRIAPGITFKQGVKLWGLDVAAVLDQVSGK